MSASLSTRTQMPTMPHHQLREHYLEAPNESHTAVHNPGITIADMRAGACAHNRGSTTSAASSLRVQVPMPPPPQLRFHCLHTCKRLVTTRPARIYQTAERCRLTIQAQRHEMRQPCQCGSQRCRPLSSEIIACTPRAFHAPLSNAACSTHPRTP
jgi:hypothetical protein